MLAFADTPWDVFSATAAFLIGLFFAIFQKKLFNINQWNAIIYYIWHTSFCLFYYMWSLRNPADATKYYRISLDLVYEFNLGTRAIYHLTSFFSDVLGMSYGGVFLVYNIFGFIGMIAFAGALRELLSGTSRRTLLLSHLVLLAPGLSFWSSAIGKDGLALMGAGLACWSVLNLRRRHWAMVVAIGSLMLTRPHMAGILLICLAVTVILFWRTSFLKKLMLVLSMIPAVIVAVVVAINYVGLEAVGFGDVEEYIEKRQGYNMDGGSSVDIASMSIMMRLFTYLFRPLFFERLDILGLAVSVENLFFLTLFCLFIWRCFTSSSLLPSFARAFCVIFVTIALLILANTTANLGIAIRQKWMFMPMLVLLMFSYIGRRPAPLPSAVNESGRPIPERIRIGST